MGRDKVCPQKVENNLAYPLKYEEKSRVGELKYITLTCCSRLFYKFLFFLKTDTFPR